MFTYFFCFPILPGVNTTSIIPVSPGASLVFLVDALVHEVQPTPILVISTGTSP